MPLTSVSGMHVTGRLILSAPPSEGIPRRVTQLSQYGGNLTIVLEVQFHGFHAFFTRVHGHPPFWSRILSAHPGRASLKPALPEGADRTEISCIPHFSECSADRSALSRPERNAPKPSEQSSPKTPV